MKQEDTMLTSKAAEAKKSKTGVISEETKTRKRKVNKTWEAATRLKGSLIVNDPQFLL